MSPVPPGLPPCRLRPRLHQPPPLPPPQQEPQGCSNWVPLLQVIQLQMFHSNNVSSVERCVGGVAREWLLMGEELQSGRGTNVQKTRRIALMMTDPPPTSSTLEHGNVVPRPKWFWEAKNIRAYAVLSNIQEIWAVAIFRLMFFFFLQNGLLLLIN